MCSGAILLSLTGCLLAGDVGAEPADSRRPASITTTGVPAVPHELASKLAQYLDVRSAAFAGWAPNGAGMLIRTRFGNTPQLHRVYDPGGRREQVTFLPEPTSGRFLPKSESNLLVSLSDGGSENDQIHLLDLASRSFDLLTDGKSRHNLGPVRHDGKAFTFTSNQRNGRDTDLFLFDLASRKTDVLLTTDREYWSASDWSRDGTRLLLRRYVSINESYPALFDVATKAKQPLPAPAAGTIAYGPLKFSPDGKLVYLACDGVGEFQTLGRLNLETGQYEWLSLDVPWDVDEIEVDPTTGQVAFTLNEGGASGLYLIDRSGRRKLEIPLGIVSGLEFSPAGDRIGFTLGPASSPADAYSITLPSGQLSRWTYSEVGGLNPDRFVKPSLIEAPSFDGRKVPAYYFKPATATPQKPAAVLIHIHGGPESQYRPTFSPTDQFYLAELGFAILRPNVRGSAGYGKSYLKLDNADKREDSVRDIGAMLDWISQQPELDKSRVAVLGASYGGYMVLASLVTYVERIKAGVDVVGIANFVTFLENTQAYRRDLRRAEYGDERDPKMRAFFEQISPANRVARIRSALLVAHGKNDPRVPFSEAEQIVAKVRSAGRPVWTVYAANEGHGFGKRDNRDYLELVTAMFLQQHLQ